ncbi:MAG TPA: carbamoyltransferase HypF, partial [Caldilineae bacterium]|nr:carbamoyltransferase HypF [Caldilineae bacterium]
MSTRESPSSLDRIAERIHIDGIVQGVGFRPFVYRLAHELGLTGWVRNNSLGVDIHVQGPPAALDAFVRGLRAQAPPLAQIDAIHRRPLPPDSDLNDDFVIIPSEDEGGFTLISPDTATCPDCLRELFDPSDRRYRYPFINCTNCGPRFSIIRGLPYDRPNTTMAAFRMCEACQAEYDNPLDRRFHAQPNACPQCGPRVWLERADGSQIIADAQEALAEAVRWLLAGRILAIKGLGGFLLACDATNPDAVAALRARKPRPHKPLAVMMRDLAMVRAHCQLSDAEEALLTSPAAPILLLTPRPDANLAPNLAAGQRSLGVMLPYTPLHHLLLHDAARPLVMTSGNRQNEPIARTNQEARDMLTPIVDGFLWHNRPIHNRVDDSVWMITREGPTPIRRARG